MNVQVTVKTFGKNPQQFFVDIKNAVLKQINEKVEEIAYKAADNMKDTIVSSKKRPNISSTLEDAIHVYPIMEGFGIGLVSLLKTEAKHYQVLNDGGYVPKPNIGYFGNEQAPGNGINETWVHTGIGSGWFLMTSSKAIEGINYIEHAGSFIEQELNNIKLNNIKV